MVIGLCLLHVIHDYSRLKHILLMYLSDKFKYNIIMNKQRFQSGNQLTRLLTAAIVVSAAILAWILFSKVILPSIQANVSLSQQVCFTKDSYCFNYPDSWKILEEQTGDYERLALENKNDEQLLSLAIGEIKQAEPCDDRERRPLYILSSKAVDLAVSQDGRATYAVKAVSETAADGFFVPMMYLTADDEFAEVGKLETCVLEGANIVDLGNENSLVSGIDTHSLFLGSTAPSFRSLDGARDWLSNPEATVAYRVLSSLHWQADQ